MRFAVLHDRDLLTKTVSVNSFAHVFKLATNNNALVMPMPLNSLLQGALSPETYDVFVLPGINGDDSPYPKLLEPHGNAQIKDFIAKGGIFFGFCAGAYHAANAISYTADWHPHKSRNTGLLGIFNGQAHGPITPYSVRPKEFLTLPDVRLADGTSLRMPYSNGPRFIPNGTQRIETVATYQDPAINSDAIIMGRYGHGQFVLFSTLPHYVVEHGYTPNEPNAFGIMRQQFDTTIFFWRNLFARLNEQKAATCALTR